MMEHLLSPPPGARKRRKRVGRGNAAGQGTYAGRGMKGQKSRSGAKIRPGFEGGQLPIIKALPMKRGFTNRFKTYFALVKVGSLEELDAGSDITPDSLLEKGYIRNLKLPVKILGDGELTKSLNISAHKFTQSAREKIEGAGGKAQEL